MTALAVLGGAEVAAVITTYRDALRAHREELNRLNVYPVPDGDTGTNMALTLESVCEELGDTEDLPLVCKAVAHGSLMGARGNSGVILSQALRGLCATFSEARDDRIGPELVVAGLRAAAAAAYEAVVEPVEGTILTVAAAAAEGAEAASPTGERTLLDVLDRARAAAHHAVARTPSLLPVLAEAGVVDAGGLGYALLLDAFITVVDGRPLPVPADVEPAAAIAAHAYAHAHAEHGALSGPRFELMFLLAATDDAVSGLKDAWRSIGDSIAIVGGDGTWSCHVHTDDMGAAMQAGIEAGRPSRIRVTDLAGDVAHGDELSSAHVTTAVVAVGTGDGIVALLRDAGARVVLGGQSANPSTAELLDAVEGCAADYVVVLPNNPNVVPVARRVDGLTEHTVRVVPTRAVAQGLAALVAYDPDRSLEENVAAMTDAVSTVRTGEVTCAVRASRAECGPIAQGDWVALCDDGICATRASALDAAVALVDHLVDDSSELVTILVGADAVPDDTARLREHLAATHRHVEVEVHQGGQALYPYLLGVE